MKVNKRFFFIHGSAYRYEKRKTLEEIEGLVGKKTKIKKQYFYGDEVSFSWLLESVSMPLLATAEEQMYLIENYNKLGKERWVLDLIKASFSNCTLVFLKEGLESFSKEIEDFVKNSEEVKVFRLVRPSPFKIKERVTEALKEHDIRLSKESIGFVSDLFFETPNRLENELEKIFLFFEDQKENEALELEQIKPLLVEEHSGSIFEFINATLSCNRKLALKAFLQFFKQKDFDFISLQALLAHEVAKLLHYKELQNQGLTQEVIFTKIKVFHPKAKGNLRQRSNRFTLKTLYALMEKMTDFEKVLKTTSLTHLSVDKRKDNQIGKLFLEKLIFEYAH